MPRNEQPSYPTAHAYRVMVLRALAKHLVGGAHSYTGDEPHRVSLSSWDMATRAYQILLKRPEMRPYVHTSGTCVYLRIPHCRNCGHEETMHAHGKCLFSPTRYDEVPHHERQVAITHFLRAAYK